MDIRPTVLFYNVPPDVATREINEQAQRLSLTHIYYSWKDGDPLPGFDALICTTLPLEHFEQLAPRSALIRGMDKREWPGAA